MSEESALGSVYPDQDELITTLGVSSDEFMGACFTAETVIHLDCEGGHRMEVEVKLFDPDYCDPSHENVRLEMIVSRKHAAAIFAFMRTLPNDDPNVDEPDEESEP